MAGDKQKRQSSLGIVRTVRKQLEVGTFDDDDRLLGEQMLRIQPVKLNKHTSVRLQKANKQRKTFVVRLEQSERDSDVKLVDCAPQSYTAVARQRLCNSCVQHCQEMIQKLEALISDPAVTQSMIWRSYDKLLMPDNLQSKQVCIGKNESWLLQSLEDKEYSYCMDTSD